jgi:thymidine phosphorylase
LSKKLAAGLQYLVMDVKTGSGAFMAKKKEAQTLARSLVSVANGAGLKTTALITDMDEPLASAAGNAVEVQNAIDYLTGKHRDARLHEVTLALGAELLLATKVAGKTNAKAMLQKTLDDGTAAERFQRMVTALGGPHDLVECSRQRLPQAPIVRPVTATKSGKVAAIATRELGIAVIELGGGRRVAADKIDHAVGLTQLAGKGASLVKGEPLCIIHARDEASWQRAAVIVQKSYQLGVAKRRGPAIIERIAK